MRENFILDWTGGKGSTGIRVTDGEFLLLNGVRGTSVCSCKMNSTSGSSFMSCHVNFFCIELLHFVMKKAFSVRRKNRPS